MDIPNYDDWKLSTPCDNEVVVGSCQECDKEIIEGMEVYDTTYGIVHEECLLDFSLDILNARLIHAER